MTYKSLLERKVTHFPAWGVLLADTLTPQPEPPRDWDESVNVGVWFERVLKLLNTTLWPKYDVASGDWCNPDLEHMHRLTAADLSLMLEMQAEDPDLLNSQPSSPVRRYNSLTHKDLFEVEDRSDFGVGIPHYNWSSSPSPVLPVSPVDGDLLISFYSWKRGGLTRHLKNKLQRPRAYQMSLAYGLTDFRHRSASSAESPSMTSGHTMDGFMMLGGLVDAIYDRKTAMSPDDWAAIEQWGVDVGDRRVMGGVHYPGDNLGSWIAVMEIVPHVFKHSSEVRKHFWQAIQRSTVYQRIAAFDEAPVYRPALEQLETYRPAEARK